MDDKGADFTYYWSITMKMLCDELFPYISSLPVLDQSLTVKQLWHGGRTESIDKEIDFMQWNFSVGSQELQC